MQNVTVHRYQNPEAVGWQGYIEPADRSWIVFVALDGTPVLFPARGADGATL